MLNWTGSQGGDNGVAANDRLLFISDPLFSAADLANWQFSNDAGANLPTGGQEIAYNGYFEVVPVPEPATWAGGALMALALAGGIRRRMRRA